MNTLNPAPKLPTTTIGGIKIVAASMATLTEKMSVDCFGKRNDPSRIAQTVFDANGQGLSLYASDKEFARDLDQGDIIHADGGFIVTLSRFKRGPAIPERSATTDLIWAAARRAEQEGLSFFLLGGEPGLAQWAANELTKKFPGLKIAGTHHGYFKPEDEASVIEKVNATRPDIVWVGLGKPFEQKFCNAHKSRLNAGWLITCGGCFHFITGDYVRAPVWMQNNGLEWLHRLASRPRALFMRYLITTPHSLYLALTR